MSKDISELHRGKGQLLVPEAGSKGWALSNEVLGLAVLTSDSTVTVVLSDSQLDNELSSRTVHNAVVMLSCRSIAPHSGPDL